MTDKEKSPTRRNVLKGVLALAGTGVSALAIDTGSSVFMRGYTDVDLLQGKDTGVLSIWAPGINADVRKQTSPLTREIQNQGDALYIQPKGSGYSEDKVSLETAEAVAMLIRKRQYARVIFNSISMGVKSNVRAAILIDALGMFEDTDTKVSFTNIDTPGSIDDISESFRSILQAARYPGGVFARTGYGVANEFEIAPDLSEDPLLVLNEAGAIARTEAPKPGSLSFADSLVYWQSLHGDDIVVGSKARAVWLNAAGRDVRTSTIEVDMPHAGLEANPDEARRAITEAYDIHLAT